MQTFRGLFKVCCEFKTEKGIVKVTPADRLVLREWPVEIKDTLLFRMLLADGSVEIVENRQDQKHLENDPAEGMTAEGKSVKRTRKKKPEAEATVEQGDEA